MDYPIIKRQTLMSDYIAAKALYDEGRQDGQEEGACLAYIYRAGLIAGKREYRNSRDRLGSKLTEAHKEIKAMREQIEMLSGIIKDNITRGAEDE